MIFQTSKDDVDAMLRKGTSIPRLADLVTIEDAAAALGFSVRALRYKQAAGEMPPRVRRGRRLFYRQKDIAALASRMM